MGRRDDAMKVGVAWYAEDEWARLREVAADPEVLEATYAEWLQGAETALRDLAGSGVAAERVPVKLRDLQEWCGQHGRPVDGRARSEFAADLLRRRYTGTGERGGA